ncbi:MAG: ribose 5-phosphate isomerase B [Sandaracinaceae bacterium]|nr:ribose 5-phosphate isomerase B [Sandaracinaceae bacterium]
MRIAIVCDHAGLPLKRALLPSLEARATQVRDVGTHDEASCDYPDYAHELARLVANGEVDLGVLICGSGVGMSIAANRHAGVRAVVCSEPYSAAMARKHNDANVLCMGARVVGPGLAEGILEAFLSASFEGGRHARRIGKIENG